MYDTVASVSCSPEDIGSDILDVTGEVFSGAGPYSEHPSLVRYSTKRWAYSGYTVSQEPMVNLTVAHHGSLTYGWCDLWSKEVEAFFEGLLAEVWREGAVNIGTVEDIKIISEYVSDETLREMEDWGIAKQVEEILKIIHLTYLTCDKIELNISTDPEIPERKRLRVTLTVSGEPEHVLEDELQLKEQVYSDADLREAYEFITVTYKWKD